MFALLINRVFKEPSDLGKVLERFAWVVGVVVRQELERLDVKTLVCLVVVPNPLHHLQNSSKSRISTF